MNFKVKK